MQSIITKGLNSPLLITQGYGLVAVTVETTKHGGNFKRRKKFLISVNDFILLGIPTRNIKEQEDVIGIKTRKIPPYILDLIGSKTLFIKNKLNVYGVAYQELVKALKVQGIILKYIEKPLIISAKNYLNKTGKEILLQGMLTIKIKRTDNISGSVKSDKFQKLQIAVQGKKDFQKIIEALFNNE